MPQANTFHIGYVVKRYPRYSETFIVNEILAHEQAGLQLDIFALRPPSDTHFQPAIARVKAPVTYLADKGKMGEFWSTLQKACKLIPDCQALIPVEENVDSGMIYQALQLAIEIKKRGILHLHAHFGTIATAVARVAAKLTGITYSFTAHAKDIFHESVSEEGFKLLLRDAAATITVSDYNVAYLQDTYEKDAHRVTRIYNGLELDRFPFELPTARPPRIVAVGRLVEKKGFDVLIDACSLLVQRGISFDCQIIGGGDLEESLRAQISDLDVNHYVSLTGPRPQSEIVALLQQASVFAAPCVIGNDGNRDGLPTVLLESMALGTPCISTDVTGIPEILLDHETGLLISQNDAKALADAIERLLNNDDLRIKLARNARRLIEQQFDIHNNAVKIRELFMKSLLSGDAIPSSHVLIEGKS